MSKSQLVDDMVSKFLGWKLPADFCPDSGISFDSLRYAHDSPHWPVGTNLFTAQQAKEMVEHMLSGFSIYAATPIKGGDDD